jgi:multidrug efflux pump subunit AcrA (membrane-fusion protein)
MTLLLLTAVFVSGCTTSPESTGVSGRIVDETVSVGAPALPVPQPTMSTGGTTPQQPGSPSVSSFVGLGQAARVAEIGVELGEHVTAGQQLARLDDSALVAGVEAALRARRAAAAQNDLLGERLSDLDDAGTTLADRRQEVRGTLGDLESTRADLARKLDAALAQRESLKALDEALQKPGSLPSTVTPPPAPSGNAPPDPQALAKALAQIDAGIAQLEAAIARIDEGLAKAREAEHTLADASSNAEDARTALESLRAVAREALGAYQPAVDLARLYVALATLRAPVEGIVVSVVAEGEAVAVGAPVVRLRPDAASAVEVWVTPATRAELAMGDTATVRIDSRAGAPYAARVSAIGSRALFPPSWIATTEVHLMRAVPVRLTLQDAGIHLPPGTPADVDIARPPAR